MDFIFEDLAVAAGAGTAADDGDVGIFGDNLGDLGSDAFEQQADGRG